MLKKERQALIMREVNIRNKVLHADLSKKLAVSEDTIRRDLQELADEDKLVKVRGGALSKSFQTNSYRGGEIYKYQEKTAIARKAVPLLSNGMLVLVSGGTTTIDGQDVVPGLKLQGPDGPVEVVAVTPDPETGDPVTVVKNAAGEEIALGAQGFGGYKAVPKKAPQPAKKEAPASLKIGDKTYTAGDALVNRKTKAVSTVTDTFSDGERQWVVGGIAAIGRLRSTSAATSGPSAISAISCWPAR